VRDRINDRVFEILSKQNKIKVKSILLHKRLTSVRSAQAVSDLGSDDSMFVAQALNSPRRRSLAFVNSAQTPVHKDLIYAVAMFVPKKTLTARLENTMRGATSINVIVNPCGYEVLVLRGNDVIDDYCAGNSAHDSVEIIPPETPGALPLRTLKALARRTAMEFANEHNLSRNSIELNVE
jgi:hypothetical protein